MSNEPEPDPPAASTTDKHVQLPTKILMIVLGLITVGVVVGTVGTIVGSSPFWTSTIAVISAGLSASVALAKEKFQAARVDRRWPIGLAVIALVVSASSAVVLVGRGGGEATASSTASASPTPIELPSCAPPPAPATKPTVSIEATLTVANVTKGDTEYAPEVSAELDDVVKFSAWYYNRGNVGTAEAEDLAVQFIPSRSYGPTHWFTIQVYGANTNRVTAQAQVRVPKRDYYVQFIPGSAKWRHNATRADAMPDWQEQPICNDVVGRGGVIEDAGTCIMCEVTVTILARVVKV